MNSATWCRASPSLIQSDYKYWILPQGITQHNNTSHASDALLGSLQIRSWGLCALLQSDTLLWRHSEMFPDAQLTPQLGDVQNLCLGTCWQNRAPSIAGHGHQVVAAQAAHARIFEVAVVHLRNGPQCFPGALLSLPLTPSSSDHLTLSPLACQTTLSSTSEGWADLLKNLLQSANHARAGSLTFIRMHVTAQRYLQMTHSLKFSCK